MEQQLGKGSAGSTPPRDALGHCAQRLDGLVTDSPITDGIDINLERAIHNALATLDRRAAAS